MLKNFLLDLVRENLLYLNYLVIIRVKFFEELSKDFFLLRNIFLRINNCRC